MAWIGSGGVVNLIVLDGPAAPGLVVYAGASIGAGMGLTGLRPFATIAALVGLACLDSISGARGTGL